jgi:hypothetical protein
MAWSYVAGRWILEYLQLQPSSAQWTGFCCCGIGHVG